MSLLQSLRIDRAENSIMQTITIAVSAILIAAGLITAPGLINNARDNNARGDLSNIAYAQESMMADIGEYSPIIKDDIEGNKSLDEQPTTKFTLSDGATNHAAIVCNDPEWAYLLKATSQSGKTFYRSSESTKTSTDSTILPIAPCLEDLLEEFLEPDLAAPVVELPNALSCPVTDRSVLPAAGTEFYANCDAFPLQLNGTYVGVVDVNITPNETTGLPKTVSLSYKQHRNNAKLYNASDLGVQNYRICKNSAGVYQMQPLYPSGGVISVDYDVSTCYSGYNEIVALVVANQTKQTMIWSKFGGEKGFAPGILGALEPFGYNDGCTRVPRSTYFHAQPSQKFHANCDSAPMYKANGDYAGVINFDIDMNATAGTPNSIKIDYRQHRDSAKEHTYSDLGFQNYKICQNSGGFYQREAVYPSGGVINNTYPTLACSVSSSTVVGLTVSNHTEEIILWSKFGGKKVAPSGVLGALPPIGAGQGCITVEKTTYFIAQPNQKFHSSCSSQKLHLSDGSHVATMAISLNMDSTTGLPVEVVADYTQHDGKSKYRASDFGWYQNYKICATRSGVNVRMPIYPSGSVGGTYLVDACTGGSTLVGLTSTAWNDEVIIWSKYGTG